MIFSEHIIVSCKHCGLALSEYNTTGFCTHFCANRHTGVAPEPPQRRGPTQVKPDQLTAMQNFLARAKPEELTALQTRIRNLQRKLNTT